MTLYIKIQDTSFDSAVERVNSAMIQSRSAIRVGNNTPSYFEKIPYAGITPFQEYLYTFMPEAPDYSEDELKSLAKSLSIREIGLSDQADDIRSVRMHRSKEATIKARNKLNDYCHDMRTADRMLEDVLGILLAE